jgi:branched-chain amino acid transport system ATP-binding protein
MALLEVRNVTTKFGSLVANDDVSFDIEQGSIVGLIGPNGAGKTTLFNCISGLYRPSSGIIRFDGRDITAMPANKVARLGAVRTFQVVHPLKEMTLLDNVLVGAFLRHRDPKKANQVAQKWIQACRLSEHAHKTTGDLPIGLKKRLEMARALSTEPKLLMLDESMAGLTSTEVKESVELIKSIRDSGITLMIVEHIMEAIMPIADSIVVLDGGSKIAEGPPREIVENEQVIKAYFGEKYSQRMKQNEGAQQHD